MNIKEIADIISLKELVDCVSVSGDKKDFKAQVQLFAENALSETFVNGNSILKLTGRREMEEAFGEFLKDFRTVYHFNGQQVVAIDGNKVPEHVIA